ncbi:hypothetical protein BKA69DRAFT_672961 [Paraphysoderma sedebokerense]|nr:hypothetical protein BKA69DRAFT_672961 [Paraphysoderma sedebokerense]
MTTGSSASKCIFDYPDILDTLFQYLRTFDLTDLRLTNKYLAEYAKDAVFFKCSVSIKDLDEFADSEFAKYVRKLEIRQYDDYLFDMNEETFWHVMPNLREVEFTSVQGTCTMVGEARVSYDLLSKLKRFTAWVQIVELPKSIPPTLEHLNLIHCEYVDNPEALSTCINSLRLNGVRLPSPLEFHSSLTHLNITSNIKLVNLPPSLISLTYYAVRQYNFPEALPAGLQYLDCSSNDWGSLPPLPSGLKFLNCSKNKLDFIENLPLSLEVLICDGNNLESPAMLPQSLKMLSCSYNPLWDYFSCSDSQPLPPSLKALTARCGPLHKGLGSALPSSLLFFDCGYSKLTSIPLLPPLLEELNCCGNKLESLPPLPTSLQILRCYGNNLTVLPTLPKSIRLIDCDHGISIPPLPSHRPFYRHKNEWEEVDNWKNIYTKI